MSDKFSKFPSSILGPASEGFPITPNDSANFTQATRAIYVGGAGTLTVMMNTRDNANTILSFIGVPVGTTLQIRAKRMYTNSTATNVIGLY